jgi:hypothetical protein
VVLGSVVGRGECDGDTVAVGLAVGALGVLWAKVGPAPSQPARATTPTAAGAMYFILILTTVVSFVRLRNQSFR